MIYYQVGSVEIFLIEQITALKHSLIFSGGLFIFFTTANSLLDIPFTLSLAFSNLGFTSANSCSILSFRY